MRRQVLSAIIALSLLAVVFVAVSTSAAVYYTGSVKTTDNTGAPQTEFFRGERAYVDIALDYMGAPVVEDIRVELRSPTGAVLSWFDETTDDPADGQYQSWLTPAHWLNTGAGFSGNFIVYDVVVLVDMGFWNEEVMRTQVIVVNEGFSIDPQSWWYYYPGESVKMTLWTSQTADFYVQVVNDTYEDYLNWTNLEAVDGYWSDTWVIPSDIPDGTYEINVRAETGDAIWYSETIGIQAYMVMIDSTRDSYLPGETAEVTYQIIDVATFQPHTGVTIEWNATWTNESGNETYDWGVLSGTSGVAQFLIPDDIALYSDFVVQFWANDTHDRSVQQTIWFGIEMMSVDVDLDSGPYMPGDRVEMTVEVDIDWDSMPGAAVEIDVEKDGNVIAAYGASGLMTNVYGETTHSFALASDASLGTYLVTVTVEKLGYEISTMRTFEVSREASFTGDFVMDLYYSGESAVIQFEVVWNGQTVTGYPIFYLVYTDLGLLTTGSTNGSSATVAIPSDYTGYIQVESGVNINGNLMSDWDDAEVAFASVAVTALSDEYRPGDSVAFVYEVLTGVTGGTAEYAVYDNSGEEVDSGTLANAKSGSFDFDVPDDAAQWYRAEVTYKDGTGRSASGSDTVWLLSSYELRIWFKSGSGYASGAYKPGSTITIGYEILVYTDAPASAYRIVYSTWLDDMSHTVLVTALEGTLTYEIPDNAGDAEVWLYASLYDAVENDWLDDAELGFETDPSLSSWDKSLAGMSAIDFTILLLIVIMVLLLIIVPFVRTRSGAPKAAKPAEPAPPMAEEPPKPE